jgi:hypothetical protein
MKIYKSKYGKFSGSSLGELIKLARKEYHTIQKRTPRRAPYVRSRYFMKDKIFINNFWEHLNQKSPKERVRRLKYYSCAIDLLRNTEINPDTIFNYTNMNIGLHRFYGQTKSREFFCVQVMENKRTSRKNFMSVFPCKKPK